MYDTMTRHYAHIFRGTLSPFDEDWKPEDHAAALGNDEDLIAKFEAVKLTEEKHCESILTKTFLSLTISYQVRTWILMMMVFI